MYQGIYELIGSELSFFTRKLEAQLRFQNIPHNFTFKTQQRTQELEARAGTHFIPLLSTPDKWLLHDTIAIGPLLNDRFHKRAVIPDTPLQRASCFILEDAFNHWLGKTCVHSRWCYPDNIVWVGPRFGANLMLGQSIDVPLSEEQSDSLSQVGLMMYQSFGKNVCQANGVGPETSEIVKADFQAMLKVLSACLKENDFLLGARPCIADFALVGAFKGHYTLDPEPRRWLGEYEELFVNYTNKFFSETVIEAQSWMPDDQVPETLPALLEYLQNSYFACAQPNIEAGLAGDKYFNFNYGGLGETQSRTQRRLNVARLHVTNELKQCGAPENSAIQRTYAGTGILEYYLG